MYEKGKRPFESFSLTQHPDVLPLRWKPLFHPHTITFLLHFLSLASTHHRRHHPLLLLLLLLSHLISAGRGNRGRTSDLAPNSPPLHCSNAINSTGGNKRGEHEKLLINPIKQVHGLCECVCSDHCPTCYNNALYCTHTHTHTHARWVFHCLRLQMQLFMVDHMRGQIFF